MARRAMIALKLVLTVGERSIVKVRKMDFVNRQEQEQSLNILRQSTYEMIPLIKKWFESEDTKITSLAERIASENKTATGNQQSNAA